MLTIFSLCNGMEKLRMLEEEQEMLNSSLIALTTHFAQVAYYLCKLEPNKCLDIY